MFRVVLVNRDYIRICVVEVGVGYLIIIQVFNY